MTISSAQPLQAAPPPKPPPQAARVASAPAPESAAPQPDPVASPKTGGRDTGPLGNPPNPSIRMDPALGIVVLEFRDQKGAVRSIPTERELEAYRMAAATRSERAAEGAPSPGPTRAAE